MLLLLLKYVITDLIEDGDIKQHSKRCSYLDWLDLRITLISLLCSHLKVGDPMHAISPFRCVTSTFDYAAFSAAAFSNYRYLILSE